MTTSKFTTKLQHYIYAGLGLILGLLAFFTPYLNLSAPASFIGSVLMWAALLELLHGFKRAQLSARYSAWLSGAITLTIAVLMLNAKLFKGPALVNFIIILFAVDAIRYTTVFLNGLRTKERNWNQLFSGVGNVMVMILIMVFKGEGLVWVISLAAALRIFGTIYQLFTARIGTTEAADEDVIESFGHKGNKELEKIAKELAAEEKSRASVDTSWIITILFILFFIHLGRMGLDRTALGILSPLVAVVGDAFMALIFAFALFAPLQMLFRQIHKLYLKSMMKWVTKKPESERKKYGLRALFMLWLKYQLRLSIRIRKSGYSYANALRNGLRIGLPFSALLAAVIPVLGMSWYFDTENWASGMWDGYASSRTDVWRAAMVEASGEKIDSKAFQVKPIGVTDTTDFSFVVIGDTGEGDASQQILKDQILTVSNKPDVKFVVISSDVVYPSGAMKDYERKFYLAFKGVHKPIYAIPGNHDWYDALDGFIATFFTPEAAKKAMLARDKASLKLTIDSEKTANDLINQASHLKNEYSLPVGYQKAPFFQISTDDFVLITVDTGVLRCIDDLQMAWLKAVLDASKNKYVMVVLGHPFYAIGEYQGNKSPEFRKLHELLRAYKVPLVMAGDTHDMEYYKELPQNGDGHTMYHFVNGGGGAYLSMGAAMAPKESRPTVDWAIYPSREPLMAKIDSLTPKWKYPAWMWLKKYNGYPFSAEWLSAAFDYNQAPYFQSFMEIKVERSKKRIRLIPIGINGQLKWGDFESGGLGKPASAKDNELAQWVLPMGRY